MQFFFVQVGLESIEDPTIQQNLKGRSRFMNKKGWVDPQGRKGKVRNLCVRFCDEVPWF